MGSVVVEWPKATHRLKQMNGERHYCIPLPPICPPAAVKSPIKVFKVYSVVQCGSFEAKLRVPVCKSYCAKLSFVCLYVLA